MIKPLFVFAALVTSQCAPEAPTVVVTQAKPVSLPAECTSPDATWHDLPDADVKRSEAARHDRINKDRYKQLLGKRRVCRAAISALSAP